LAQDRPEEFKLYRLSPPKDGEKSDEFERRKFANVAALLAVLALILVGYWVFTPWVTAADFSVALIPAAAIASTSSIRRSEQPVTDLRHLCE
jgi:hypothetical protein